MRYAVIIEEGKNSFGAYVPDLPGCVAVAETREEVFKLIEDAIEFHVEGLREEGAPIPPPSSSIVYAAVHATYNIVRDASNRWLWHLVAANGRLIATSSESYETKAQCLEAIDLVRSLSSAPVKAA
jgi:predicted RNase H-like HicB family nuclease/uncharacterized protein YegP (UPF0339 family)